MQDGGDSDVDSEEEFDDFLSDDKPKESSEDRQARIKRLEELQTFHTKMTLTCNVPSEAFIFRDAIAITVCLT